MNRESVPPSSGDPPSGEDLLDLTHDSSYEPTPPATRPPTAVTGSAPKPTTGFTGKPKLTSKASSARSPVKIRWFLATALLGQLALAIIGSLALWQIAGGWWLGAVAAGLFVLAYGAVLRFQLSTIPRERLGYQERFTSNLVLGPIVVVITSLAGSWLWALLVLGLILGCDWLDSRR